MNSNPVMSTGENATASARQRHVKNRHPPQEWEQRKELVKRLYLDEDKTVEEVMRYLKDEEGFIVGERKFKMQLKEWGFEKNIKSSILRLMLAKATKRKFEEDKNTKFRYKGRDILPERLGHFAKRSHVKNGKRFSPSASTPSVVSYCTNSTNLSSLSAALHRVASMNGSAASIASTASVLRHGTLALRRSLSNLSGHTFSSFRRRNSYHSDRRPMSLVDLDDFSFPADSHIEMSYVNGREISQFEAVRMSVRVIHGCKSCQRHMTDAVKTSFDKLRSFCTSGNYGDVWAATEELSRTISPLCHTCRVIAHKYILSLRYLIARNHSRIEIYDEMISRYEKIIQTCMELDLNDCSYIMFSCIRDLSELYAYHGLLHEVEQRLLCARHDGEDNTTLTWCGDHLMLAEIYKLQQRPQDVLREHGKLSTFCIQRFGLHSGFMHGIVYDCAQACYVLQDYRTSTDLYRRLLAEDVPSGSVLTCRIVYALIGLSDVYRSAGCFQHAIKYAYRAVEALQVDGSAPVSRFSGPLRYFLLRCYLNLGVSFDNEGNSVEAESYLSRVVVGCEHMNREYLSPSAVSIMLDLRRHYFDKPRRIDALAAKIDDSHLPHLANTLSGNPVAIQQLLVVIIWQADSFSRSHRFEDAEYLFNQAKGLLEPNNLRFQYFFTLQIGQHHRRKGEWKLVMQCLEKAVALSERQHGTDHVCTTSFKERLAACREEMEKRGLSANAIAQSLSLLSISSSNTSDPGSEDVDELDFLEDGVWGRPPASLMDYA